MKTCVSTHKLVEEVNSFTSSHSITTRDLCRTRIAAKSVPHLLTDVQQQNDISVHQTIKKKTAKKASVKTQAGTEKDET
jgi:hypothetical protein